MRWAMTASAVAVPPEKPVLRVGDVVLDPRRVSVTLGAVALALTRPEFLILAALMERPDTVRTHDELARAARLRGTAKRHVHGLRAKLRRAAAAVRISPPVIAPVRRVGYRLLAQSEAGAVA